MPGSETRRDLRPAGSAAIFTCQGFCQLMRSSKPLFLIVVVLLTTAIGLLPAQTQCLELFRNFSYFFLLALFLCWLLRLVGCIREHAAGLLREHYRALALALVLMGLIFAAAPPRFKVLADEANLLGVSLGMHLDQTAAFPVSGFLHDSAAPDLVFQVDKRPAFFPFLVAGIHALGGYRPQNAFVLNFLAGWGVLIAGYAVVLKLLPRRCAAAAVLFMASAPCFVVYSTSGGFEILNLFFIVMTFLTLAVCLEKQAAPRETELFFLTLLLLSQCRYESILFIPILGLALLPALIRNRFFQKASGLTCALPVFLVPMLWQRKGFHGAPEMEINKLGQEVFQRADSLFSFKRLLEQIDDNLFVLLGLDPHFGFSPVLAGLAAVGGYLLIRRFVLRRLSGSEIALFAATFASFLGLLGLLSSFFWGLFTLPMDNRLAIVFLPYLVCAAAFGGHRICRALKIDSAPGVYLFAAAHLLVFWPYGVQQRLVNSMALPYEYRQATAELSRRYPPDVSTVILAEQPNLYIVQGYSALHISEVDARAELLAAAAAAARLIALQKVNLQTGSLQKASELKAGFDLEPVLTIPISYEVGLRISECRLKPE